MESQEIGIKFTITDCSIIDKRCSVPHFLSFLFYYYCTTLTFLAWVVSVSNLQDSEFFTYISNIKFSRFLLCVSTYFATIQFAKRAFPFVLSNNQDM